MELKPYQQEVINNLETFLEYKNKYRDSAKAFNAYWESRSGKYQVNLDVDTGTEKKGKVSFKKKGVRHEFS